eukprot:TRINITY_DN99179_c0_g1_i1.p1 TRINITY_DN99179_c0_g1~~TRINITY_DN99179_c0_g1_i1.p1  ORF type:complete len:428 (-),score=91.80 TRINITY_DN99179_c0_g1_i1:20-1282(-)
MELRRILMNAMAPAPLAVRCSSPLGIAGEEPEAAMAMTQASSHTSLRKVSFEEDSRVLQSHFKDAIPDLKDYGRTWSLPAPTFTSSSPVHAATWNTRSFPSASSSPSSPARSSAGQLRRGQGLRQTGAAVTSRGEAERTPSSSAAVRSRSLDALCTGSGFAGGAVEKPEVHMASTMGKLLSESDLRNLKSWRESLAGQPMGTSGEVTVINNKATLTSSLQGDPPLRSCLRRQHDRSGASLLELVNRQVAKAEEPVQDPSDEQPSGARLLSALPHGLGSLPSMPAAPRGEQLEAAQVFARERRYHPDERAPSLADRDQLTSLQLRIMHRRLEEEETAAARQEASNLEAARLAAERERKEVSSMMGGTKAFWQAGGRRSEDSEEQRQREDALAVVRGWAAKMKHAHGATKSPSASGLAAKLL